MQQWANEKQPTSGSWEKHCMCGGYCTGIPPVRYRPHCYHHNIFKSTTRKDFHFENEIFFYIVALNLNVVEIAAPYLLQLNNMSTFHKIILWLLLSTVVAGEANKDVTQQQRVTSATSKTVNDVVSTSL